MIGSVSPSLSPKSVSSSDEDNGFDTIHKSFDMEKQTRSTSDELEKERESYIRQCNSLNIEPTLEFLLALCDSDMKSCVLSKRKKPLGDDDVGCISAILQSNKTVTELHICDNNVSKDGASKLAEALTVNNVLRSLYLGSNIIGDQGVISICTALQQNITSGLNILDISNNNIGSKDALTSISHLICRNTLKFINLQKNNIDCNGCIILVNALEKNSSLENLNLKSNQIMELGGKALGDILSTNATLKDLDLGSNNIGQAGGVSIANGLHYNTTLIRLNLRSNSIKDQGAFAFAQVFGENVNNVQELNLGYNGITVDGATQLSDMLKRNTKLRKFDMQGIMLDIHGVKHVADSIRHNRSLLHFKIDIDSESGSKAAKTLSEALKSNQTIQDLVIGSEVELDHEMTSSINHSLNRNKSLADGDFDELFVELQPKLKGLTDSINEQTYDVVQELEEERKKVKNLESIIHSRESELVQKQAEISLCQSKILSLEDKDHKISTHVAQESLDREREKNRILEEQYRTTYDTLQYEQKMVEMYRRKITNLEYDLSEYRDRLSRDSIKGRAMEGALNDLKQQLENTRLGYSTEITKLREMERSTQFELSLNKKTVEEQRNKVSELENKLNHEEDRLKVLTEEIAKEKRRTIDLEHKFKTEHETTSKLETILEQDRKEKLAQLVEINSVNEEVRKLNKEMREVEEKVIEKVNDKLDETVRSIFSKYFPTINQQASNPAPLPRSQHQNYGSVNSFVSDTELKEYVSVAKDLRHLYSISPIEEETQSQPTSMNISYNSRRKATESRGLPDFENKIYNRLDSVTAELRSEISNIKQELTSFSSSNNISTVISLDQVKMENDLKLNKSIRDMEDRINQKLTEMDNRHSTVISNLRKHIDDSLELQRGIISKMTEEQRWMEEEGIRLRVEHEARIHNELKALEDRLRRDGALTKANRIEAQLRKLTDNLQKAFDQEEDTAAVVTPTASKKEYRYDAKNSSLKGELSVNALQSLLSRSGLANSGLNNR